MIRAEERLTLVTDFGSLRQGDLVVVFGCLLCDAVSHRGMVVSRGHGELVDAAGDDLSARDFVDVAPEPACIGDGYFWSVDAEDVADRIVYLVDTGLSRETDTHEAKPVTKPRELARGTR